MAPQILFCSRLKFHQSGNFTTGIDKCKLDTFCVGRERTWKLLQIFTEGYWGWMEKRVRVIMKKKTRGEETDALLVLWFMLPS